MGRRGQKKAQRWSLGELVLLALILAAFGTSTYLLYRQLQDAHAAGSNRPNGVMPHDDGLLSGDPPQPEGGGSPSPSRGRHHPDATHRERERHGEKDGRKPKNSENQKKKKNKKITHNGDEGQPLAKHGGEERAGLLHRLAERAKKSNATSQAGGGKNTKHHARHRIRHHPKAPYHGLLAFAVVVSNEEFVDGALALAWSFRTHSTLLREGRARLVVVVPEGALSPDSLERLRLAGWTDQRIVDDLTKQAGKSLWAGTFNKLYFFHLTEYERVSTWDVDMLILQSPDAVFDVDLPNATYVGALGNPRDGKHQPYFQTGMMVLIPKQDIFDTMMDDFKTRPENREVNGRDGVIIRRYYGARYVNLADGYSAHLKPTEPLDDVVGFHYRGSWKPWFDPSKPKKEDPRDKNNGKPDFGPAFYMWWMAYMQLHQAVLQHLPVVAASRDPGQRPPPAYNPRTDVWLMRHTPDSYVVPVWSNASQLTIPGAELHVADEGESCDDACAVRTAACAESALLFDETNRCDKLLQSALEDSMGPCSAAASAEHSIVAPAWVHVGPETGTPKSLVVGADRLSPPDGLPSSTCNAAASGVRRICPCVPLRNVWSHLGPVPSNAPVVSDASGGGGGGGDPLPLVPSLGNPAGTVSPSKAGRSTPTPTSRESSLCPTDRTDWFAEDESCRTLMGSVADPAAILDVAFLPQSASLGKTKKLIVRLRQAPELRVLVKLPQADFPLEAHSEGLAYHVDRLLGINRVPPTTVVWLRVPWLREVLGLLPAAFVRGAHDGSSGGGASSLNSNAAERAALKQFCIDDANSCEPRDDGDGMQILASVQLWMDDVHRVADTTLALPDTYASWLEPTHPGPASESERELAALLSDTILFDYVIANTDRTATRNLYVAGGCTRHCRSNRGERAHQGSAQWLLLDQGRGFVDVEEDIVKALKEAASGDGYSRDASSGGSDAANPSLPSETLPGARLSPLWPNQALPCRVRKTTMDTLKAFIEDTPETADAYAAKFVVDLKSRVVSSPSSAEIRIFETIDDNHLGFAQQRLKMVYTHLSMCTARAQDPFL